MSRMETPLGSGEWANNRECGGLKVMANYITNEEIAQAVSECNAHNNEPTEGFCLAVKTIA